ncbi:mandelate racemase/muconate lactonizing enzyme family protein [Thalassococcus profundi]|uniref:Mandelate racemase/muconate lactonizing enzyme family protein n=1 Tax=Thalassococcus profundi TaxID=2282382 RepID=A0A369TX85_9RHOB|nr:enolase C-terminal domain-like protein [Thalassococcus profundi]RDD67566.1 mandelate racemase/muconate lactonizing enzyme family protein [Thalassococcus profundi]
MTQRFSLRATVHSPPAMPGDAAPYAGADSFTFVRVELRDGDGVTGNGFTGRFLAPEVAHFLNGAAAEALAEAGDDPLPDLRRRFNPRAMTGVVVSALSALEIALCDLRAKRLGLSVAQMLGGARASAPVHVTCGFPALDTEALVEACGAEVAAGARGVKVLIAAKGRTVAQDLARLRAVRDAIGPGAELIADANCRMDLDTARAFSRGAVELNLAWLEEPVAGNDRHALASLAAEARVPIGAGQMEQSADRFDLLTEAGIDVLQPNAVFAGGICAAVAAAQAGAAAGCAVSPAGGWDLVNLHWMCGALTDGAVELHRAQTRIARMLLPDLPTMSEGNMSPSDRPGLGLMPDEERLAACRVG